MLNQVHTDMACCGSPRMPTQQWAYRDLLTHQRQWLHHFLYYLISSSHYITFCAFVFFFQWTVPLCVGGVNMGLLARLVPRLLFCHLHCEISYCKWWIWLVLALLVLKMWCFKFCRNLKIAHFTQHHVDQLVMDTTSLELIQSRFPGEGNHWITSCNIVKHADSQVLEWKHLLFP